MKSLNHLIIILLISNISVFSQDLIITKKGDSINCKIRKIKKEYIHFTFKHKKSDEIRNTLLPLDGITKYQYNFYQNKEVDEDYKPFSTTEKKFQLDVYGGYSYRTAKIDEKQEALIIDYIKGLKSGYHFGADATYFISDAIGIGLKFNKSMASNRLSNVSMYDNTGEVVATGNLEDNITLTFIGATYVSKLVHGKNKNAFYYSLGLGYLGYYDESEAITDRLSIKGHTFGTSFDAGYNLGISNNLSLGLRFSVIGGRLFEITREYNNGTTETYKYPDNNYESLYRIDLSIGLVYSL